MLAVSGTLALNENFSPTLGSAVVIVTLVTYAAEAVTEKSSDNSEVIKSFFIYQKELTLKCKNFFTKKQ